MLGRIVEIAESRRYLSKYRGFMVIREGDDELGRIPLDDISAVIVTGYGVTHSSNLLAALAKRGIPFVLCASNHSPVGMLWSVEGNYHQAKRINAQLEIKKPVKKRLWQQVVRCKLAMQAGVLKSLAKPDKPITALIPKVKSGDPENIEGQGARRYWQALFGKEFRRNRNAEDLNALLNYGYTILRAATARSIIAAGLHPSLGIHHSNAYNAMQLVDDLMEPFRAIVDNRVYHLNEELDDIEINKVTKQALARLMYKDMPTSLGLTPVMNCLHRLSTSLAQVYLGERKDLELPAIPVELEMVALGRSSE
jgi:CRISPR-associated protein Cas1